MGPRTNVARYKRGWIAGSPILCNSSNLIGLEGLGSHFGDNYRGWGTGVDELCGALYTRNSSFDQIMYSLYFKSENKISALTIFAAYEAVAEVGIMISPALFWDIPDAWWMLFPFI